MHCAGAPYPRPVLTYLLSASTDSSGLWRTRIVDPHGAGLTLRVADQAIAGATDPTTFTSGNALPLARADRQRLFLETASQPARLARLAAFARCRTRSWRRAPSRGRVLVFVAGESLVGDRSAPDGRRSRRRGEHRLLAIHVIL